MKYFIFILFMIGHASSVFASSTTSQIGLQTISYVGDKVGSLNGSYGYGVDVRTTKDYGLFQLSMGGNALYSNALARVNSHSYSSTLYSSNLIIGMLFSPFERTTMQPYFGMFGLGGFKYLEFATPPPNQQNSSLSLSLGYMLSLGVQYQTQPSRFYDISIDYISNTASEIAGQNNFDFSGLGIKVGLGF